MIFQPSCGVHQRRTRADQRRSGADHRQMKLRFGTAMSYRPQQARIDSCESCQRPGIELIIFSTTLADQSHVPRMRHDHFVTQLGQLPADPGGVGPGF
jgi:hypothetical protein